MIVIPMAGISSRFFKAGYTKPKYMLEAHGKTLFDHSVNSFSAYFNSKPFLFIVRDVFDTAAFVSQSAKKMGIKEFYIVALDQETRGQAETVALGLAGLSEQGIDYKNEITIFNIDTFRPNFIFPLVANVGAGYLEVFQGSGDNWSFAKPKQNDGTEVIETAEKKPISDLCSTGLYHFTEKSHYLEAYSNYLSKPQVEWEQGELYIAPLYNYLIKKDLKVNYHRIDRNEVIFCGIPTEYSEFLQRCDPYEN
ncbi:glycosyltransferase family 2 protein [uncultured Oceanisphaera sp.]|uniref:glycosyltransferase family 2 protein n=1 Tax=uncultured Oceanisphaera sp. TaxID=353858 RepID=UPI002628C25B|nr:glycosyltransferase family 2 protein [uncultured Oceanisphaera sp.]